MYGIGPTPSGMFLAAALFAAAFIFCASLVRWWIFSDSLAQLLRIVKPNPLHADRHCGLGFIGHTCLHFYVLLATGGVCLLVLAVQDQLLHKAPMIEMFFILLWILGSPILILLPIYYAHRVIVRQRNQLLFECSTQLTNHSIYDAELERLHQAYSAIQSSSRWPVDISTTTAVIVAVAFQAILPSLLEYLIGQA